MDVNINGADAAEYAQAIKGMGQGTKNLILEQAKGGMVQVNKRELGRPTDPTAPPGTTIAGLAGNAGDGQAKVDIDLGNKSESVLAHELLHTKGRSHGGAMDAEVNKIVNS
jgi:hypothetical protein